MGRYIVSFKTIVNFFITIQNYNTYSSDKKNFLWKRAQKIVHECNKNMGTIIAKSDLLYCKIKELTVERFEIWVGLRKRLINRFMGTEYETLIIEKFVKKKSYVNTSMKTYQSISNYYIKIERIYQYAITLAYHDDLIDIE